MEAQGAPCLLYTSDVHRLIEVLHTLVENGNSVLVIEHNLDVIKTADHIIDPVSYTHL